MKAPEIIAVHQPDGSLWFPPQAVSDDDKRQCGVCYRWYRGFGQRCLTCWVLREKVRQ